MSDLTHTLAALSPEKREVLESLLLAGNDDLGAFPLSFAQARLWFLDRLHPGTALYNMPAAVRLAGALDRAALERALAEVVRRHEALRTTFVEVNGRPFQVVSDAVDLALPVDDLSVLSAEEREEVARRRASAEARAPFDLARGPLLRASLLRLAKAEHLLVLVFHHIVADEHSVGVFVRELAALYAAYAAGREPGLPEPALQYVDFARWQREWLQGEVLERQLAWWRERLAGELPAVEPVRDRPRPMISGVRGVREGRGGRVAVGLAEAGRGVRELARAEGATPFMVLLAAFGALLGRVTGLDDVVVGSPVAGRNRPQLDGVIGFFVNTLALRLDLAGDPTFRELLRRAKAVAAGAFANQDVPFERLVEELRPERSAAAAPLVQVLLAYQEGAPRRLELPGLTVTREAVDPGAAKFDLTLEAEEGPDGLAGAFEYDADLYDRETVERLGGWLRTLLTASVASPDRRLSELPLTSAAERSELVALGSGGEIEAPAPDLAAVLAERAAATPDAVAASQGGLDVTYAELRDRAGKLAAFLEDLEVGPEVPVALCLDPSPALAEALWAVLGSGGAWLPLDPAVPAERATVLLRDAGARVALTSERFSAKVSLPGVRALRLDGDRDLWRGIPPGRPPKAAPLESAAYLLYTSGSTGAPKGVAVSRRSLAHHARAVVERYGLTAADSVLQLASPAFDVAIEETFPAWAVGARVVFPPSTGPGAVSPAGLSELIERERLTVLNLPSSFWREWVAELERDPRPLSSSLRLVVVGSEPVPAEAVERWGEVAGPVRLLNGYGLTETTITSTVADLGGALPAGPVPVGRPLAGISARVLDRGGEPAPFGVPGELHVGGPGVARGYLGRPDATAERFVPDPFSADPGARLFRTGDLARLRPDGSLQLLGRADRQLKLRGFRIEPGEVEAALERLPGVREAAVDLWTSPAGPVLAAWVSPSGLDARALRAALAERLPSHLVPAVVTALDALPRTPSGKLDRRALPAPEAAPSTGVRAAFRTPVEELVAGVWERVLGASGVGPDDAFFDLGGHSLLAAQAAARLSEALGVEIPLRALFERPTVSALAAFAEGLRGTAPRPAPPLVPVPRDRALPLSFAQERLWFLDRLQPGGSLYNMPAALRLSGPLDEAALAGALAAVVRRHESLRTRFPTSDGVPVQAIAPAPASVLSVVDLSVLPAAVREAEAAALAAAEGRRGFNLAKGSPIRATLLRLGATERRLLLTLHHIASDGWSFGLLVREVNAAVSGGALPALPIQYADFAVWQRGWLRGAVLEEQLAYWRERLRGVPVLALPTDRPRPPLQSFRGGSRPFRLEREHAEGLRALARRQGATLFMVLLAGLDALLARYAGQEDVVLGTPVANRERPGTESLIGLFLNMLALRADLSGDPGFGELVRRVREVNLGAYAHQDLPFEKLVAVIAPERDLSRMPVFQVMLAFQNTPMVPLRLPGVAVQPLAAGSGAARYDLTVSMEETADGGLAGSFEYAADLWDAATVDGMAARLAVLLAAAATGPALRLSELPVLDEAAERQLLAGWNDTRVEVPATTVDRLFAARAATAPDTQAVTFEGASLSYGELAARVGALARRLRSLGVGPEVRVGLALERSLDMVVGMLGILAAGGAYVPLDPGYPKERLAWIVEDSGVPVVLTQPHLRGRLPIPDGVTVVDEGYDGEDSIPEALAAPENAAYVIYTSGSTGRPKGVVVAHGNAANFFVGMDRVLGTDPGTWLAVTSVSFDISVLELLWTLTRGFRVVVQGREAEGGWFAADEAPAVQRAIDFSLFYFADEGGDASDRYRLLLEGARFADRHGFAAVWTPERHFHAFGGLYPNPAVTGAALAAVTERIEIRAGSVVLPLHDPVRVAEEWAVVDNLSHGRVAVSFASGWHADDFVLAPANYRRRKDVMLEGIDTVRRLWRGEAVSLPNGEGREVPVAIHPRPVQAELPFWLTAAGHPDTFRFAGERGAGLLTHLLSQTEEELAAKIAVYREAWRAAGHPGEGRVCLMLHTFVGEDRESVRTTVREPFRRYLRTSTDLLLGLAREAGLSADSLSEEGWDLLLDRAFERYFETAGLFGSPADCLRTVDRLRAVGVDEIGCLIDFGVEVGDALAGLEHLATVRERSRRALGEDFSIAAQIRREGVTHLQCTPSMARLLLADARTAATLGSLKALLLGGEALPQSLVKELPGVPIVNMYGPTETTVWSTSFPVVDSVSIGGPIANTAAYVVDERLRLTPPGVPGELLLGGLGVTRGYLARPELTAERFVPDPFGEVPGARLYRTGDLARWRPDGTLEFLGRRDHQVKIRGHRIEPGEVEAALERHPGVREAVVVAREDQPGFPRLVAYAVPEARGTGALPLAVGTARREEILAAHQRFTLPNGMLVAHLGDLHTRVGYAEIFEREPYLKHGVTLEDGDIVFDVGANIGFFTLYVHTRCRPSAVYAFEVIPPTFAALAANDALYGLGTRLFNVGVGARPETAEFTFYPHLDGLSGRYADVERDRTITRAIVLDEMRRQGGEAALGMSEAELDELLAERFRTERYACPVRTLSEVIREQGVERIDLLKVDVERAELDVLRGMDAESWAKVRQVVLEVDTREDLAAMQEILAAHGFDTTAEDFVTVPDGTGGETVEVSMLYAIHRGQARTPRPQVEAATPAALKDYLRAELPEPMVPAAVVLLDALPLNPSGKIDRKALPAPEAAEAAGDGRERAPYAPPSTDFERRVAEVWRELLGVERIGIHENFFEAGGNSLLLARVHGRLREALGRDVPMVELFRNPTVASLAAFLARQDGAAAEVEEKPAPSARAERPADPAPASAVERQRQFMEKRRQRGSHVR